jgi:hypothetical protein
LNNERKLLNRFLLLLGGGCGGGGEGRFQVFLQKPSRYSTFFLSVSSIFLTPRHKMIVSSLETGCIFAMRVDKENKIKNKKI